MPVEDIRISLQLLADSIEALEKDCQERETRFKSALAVASAPQIDMFSGWSGNQAANDKTTALLARKLDQTIDRVQNILREAGA